MYFHVTQGGIPVKLNTYDLGLGGGSMLQLASLKNSIRMSYFIETPEGKIIIVDGGYDPLAEAQQLYDLIMEKGGRVDLWILSHAHSDHLGSLTILLETVPDFAKRIDKLCFNFPDAEWLSQKEDWPFNDRFLKMMDVCKPNIITPKAGDILECGGVTVEILNVPEDYVDYPSINPTSMMFLMHFPKKDVLFMGDFDVHGQAEFLQKCDASKLRCDIVQMVHHGQSGTDRSFYELIQPKYCLYNAPDWVYDNFERGSGNSTPGTGPYTTLETRRWMKEMGAIKDFTFIEGDWLFT